MNEDRGKMGCLKLLGGFLVLCIAIWVSRIITDPFHGEYDQYIQITAKQSVDVPYLRGKIVAVSPEWGLLAGPEKHRLQSALPADLQAHRPDDVGTAILLQSGHQSVGDCIYKNGPNAGQREGDAFRICYRVIIIDMSIRAIIHQQDLCGADPSATEKDSVCAGPDPLPQVLSYILSLPRK
jgi:hypothetical protein